MRYKNWNLMTLIEGWNYKKVLMLLLILITTILMAYTDSAMFEGEKQKSKLYEVYVYACMSISFLIVIYMGGLPWRNWLLVVSSFVFAHMAFFNIIYNKLIGQPLIFLGTTSKVDILLNSNIAIYPMVLLFSFIGYVACINHTEGKK